MQFFRVKIKIPYFGGCELAGILGSVILNDILLWANPVPAFPESAEVLEMKGARTLKGKRYVSEMDKNARPGKLLIGAGRGTVTLNELLFRKNY